jgi:hypothetical protein
MSDYKKSEGEDTLDHPATKTYKHPRIETENIAEMNWLVYGFEKHETE